MIRMVMEMILVMMGMIVMIRKLMMTTRIMLMIRTMTMTTMVIVIMTKMIIRCQLGRNLEKGRAAEVVTEWTVSQASQTVEKWPHPSFDCTTYAPCLKESPTRTAW